VKILTCSEDRAIGVVVPEEHDTCEEVGAFEVKALETALKIMKTMGYTTVRLGELTVPGVGESLLTLTGVPKTRDTPQGLDGKMAVAPAAVEEVDD